MRVLSKEEFLNEVKLLENIKKGAVFIYPTDTIYGIGCNAQKEETVKKIRQIKNRHDMPFSVIVPSKEWIKENCVIDKKAQEWIAKLPGPYTLILKLKNKKVVANNVSLGKDTLGVRIPDHWISKVVQNLNIPIITTSVNKSGEDFASSIEEIDHSIKSEVDFAIDEGEKRGRPSTIINLETEEVQIKKR